MAKRQKSYAVVTFVKNDTKYEFAFDFLNFKNTGSTTVSLDITHEGKKYRFGKNYSPEFIDGALTFFSEILEDFINNFNPDEQ